jgi:hypothetical protein
MLSFSRYCCDLLTYFLLNWKYLYRYYWSFKEVSKTRSSNQCRQFMMGFRRAFQQHKINITQFNANPISLLLAIKSALDPLLVPTWVFDFYERSSISTINLISLRMHWVSALPIVLAEVELFNCFPTCLLMSLRI